MAIDAAKNFASSKVTAFGGTTLTVSDGSVFGATPFNVTLWPRGLYPEPDDAAQQSPALAERLRVTSRSGNDLTLQSSPTIDTSLSVDYYVKQAFGSEEYNDIGDRIFDSQAGGALLTGKEVHISPGGVITDLPDAVMTLARAAGAADNVLLSMQSGVTGKTGVCFGDANNTAEGEIRYDNQLDRLELLVDGNVRLRITKAAGSDILFNERNLAVAVTGGNAQIKVDSGTTNTATINLGDTASGQRALVRWNNTTDELEIVINDVVVMTIPSSGDVELARSGNAVLYLRSGTSSDAELKLGDTASGNTAQLRYDNSIDTLQEMIAGVVQREVTNGITEHLKATKFSGGVIYAEATVTVSGSAINLVGRPETIIKADTTGGAQTVNNITGGADGQLLYIGRTSGSDLTLTHAAGGSGELRMAGNLSLTVASQNTLYAFIYNSSIDRWKQIAQVRNEAELPA